MNTCHIHTDREADGACSVCGRFFCDDCLVPVLGTHICKECVGKLIVSDDETEKKAAKPSPPLKCYSVYVGLALILGCIGAHDFYRGNTFFGVVLFLLAAASVIFTSALSIPPLGLILTGIVALIEAFSTTDGYGRKMV